MGHDIGDANAFVRNSNIQLDRRCEETNLLGPLALSTELKLMAAFSTMCYGLLGGILQSATKSNQDSKTKIFKCFVLYVQVQMKHFPFPPGDNTALSEIQHVQIGFSPTHSAQSCNIKNSLVIKFLIKLCGIVTYTSVYFIILFEN